MMPPPSGGGRAGILDVLVSWVAMTVRSRRLLTHWLPLLLWVGLIFFLSSRSSFPEPSLPTAVGFWIVHHKSTLAHLGEYAVLALLAYRATRTLHTRRQAQVIVLVFCLAVAGLDEAFQSTVPGRDGDLVDVAIDGAGAAVALLIAILWQRRRERSGDGAADGSTGSP